MGPEPLHRPRSIVRFERRDDAEAYLRELPGRLAKFGLELAEEKSALVKFNRWEPESSGKFTFVPSGPAGSLRIWLRRYRARGSLGFDFYWEKSRHNPKYWRVRRTTNAKKFRGGLAALKDWLKRKLQGCWNYYGVIGNSERLWDYAWNAKRLVHKWLNRRSQR
ncbi:MAG: hypothetical protein ABI162_12710, partial [Luteolibacter sp.]